MLNSLSAQGFFKLCLLLCCLTLSLQASARPKIGLALSGGGAKGSAHIGVLKVLEANNVPIDYIAGTSIGSLIGAMYALGYSAAEIEQIMLNTNWEQGYSDAIPRQDLPIRIKHQKDQFNIPLTLGISGGKMKMPSGFLRGQSMSELLRGSVGLHPNFNSFDDLAIPFRAVATDLANNEAVILDHGDLIAAIQASSTVPGALAPAEVQGYLLVDGGITNNMPVDVVKQMGADIVIAIDIGNDLTEQDDIHGTFAVLGQLSSFLTTATTELQKAHLSEKDLLLKPEIQGLGTTDWSILPDALQKGIEIAEQHQSEITAMAIDDRSYNIYQQAKQARHNQLLLTSQLPVNRVVIDNQSDVHPAFIHKKMQLPNESVLSSDEINKAIEQLYSIDQFQRVDAQLINTSTGNELQIIPKRKSWGPDFLSFGLGWESDFSQDSNLNFDIAYTKTNITRYGGEWRSQLELGAERGLSTELYLPLTPTQLLYSRSYYFYDALEWDIYNQNKPLLEVDQRSHTLEQSFGWNFTQPGALEIGLTGEDGDFENEILYDGSLKYKSYGGFLQFAYDTLDSISFPTRGNYLTAQIYGRKENVDNSSNVDFKKDQRLVDSLFVEINWKSVLNLGNHAVVGKMSYAEVFTRHDNDSIYFTSLGGFLNLSGFHKNALIGKQKIFASAIYQYDLGRSLLDLQQFPLYVGLSAESGYAGNNISKDRLIYASTLYLGTDTQLGPVAFGIGANSESQQAVYFYLGKNF